MCREIGYQSRHVYGAWRTACDRAGIAYLTPHAAGRHGFGQEVVVRQGIDPATAAQLGRWSTPRVLLDRYTHADERKTIGGIFERRTADKQSRPQLAQNPRFDRG